MGASRDALVRSTKFQPDIFPGARPRVMRAFPPGSCEGFRGKIRIGVGVSRKSIGRGEGEFESGRRDFSCPPRPGDRLPDRDPIPSDSNAWPACLVDALSDPSRALVVVMVVVPGIANHVIEHDGVTGSSPVCGTNRTISRTRAIAWSSEGRPPPPARRCRSGGHSFSLASPRRRHGHRGHPSSPSGE